MRYLPNLLLFVFSYDKDLAFPRLLSYFAADRGKVVSIMTWDLNV